MTNILHNARIRMLMSGICPMMEMCHDVFSVSDIGMLGKKFLFSPNRSQTCDLLVTSPDALPLSCRRLVGARPLN